MLNTWNQNINRESVVNNEKTPEYRFVFMVKVLSAKQNDSLLHKILEALLLVLMWDLSLTAHKSCETVFRVMLWVSERLVSLITCNFTAKSDLNCLRTSIKVLQLKVSNDLEQDRVCSHVRAQLCVDWACWCEYKHSNAAKWHQIRIFSSLQAKVGWTVLLQCEELNEDCLKRGKPENWPWIKMHVLI